MLLGRFGDTTGRPYIEGRLLIPRLNLRGDFSFLVDTGADRSYLMPGDAAVLGLDHGLMQGQVQSTGIGGTVTDFEEPAVLVFADGGRVYAYDIALAIARPTPAGLSVPSLLGRDILDQWHMRYRPIRRLLRFEVETASAIYRIGEPPSPHIPIAPVRKRR